MAQIRRSYRQGERPEAQTYDFDLVDGLPFDLTGWTVSVVWTSVAGVRATSAATVASPETLGRANFSFAAAMFDTLGRVTANVWATNGTQKIASEDFVFLIQPALGGTAP